MPIRQAPPPPTAAEGKPETLTEGGRVVQAAVPPLVDPPPRGSLADIPFTNASEAPQDVVVPVGRKREARPRRLDHLAG